MGKILLYIFSFSAVIVLTFTLGATLILLIVHPELREWVDKFTLFYVMLADGVFISILGITGESLKE